jgi:hypothetical protein
MSPRAEIHRAAGFCPRAEGHINPFIYFGDTARPAMEFYRGRAELAMRACRARQASVVSRALYRAVTI